MTKAKPGIDARTEDTLEYFLDLFETSQAKQKSPARISEAALVMMNLGGLTLTPKQVLGFNRSVAAN